MNKISHLLFDQKKEETKVSLSLLKMINRRILLLQRESRAQLAVLDLELDFGLNQNYEQVWKK